MTLAVELFVVHAVGQIDEHLAAGSALEAGRMPGDFFAEFRCHDAQRSGRNVSTAPVASLSHADDEHRRRKNVFLVYETRSQFIIKSAHSRPRQMAGSFPRA